MEYRGAMNIILVLLAAHLFRVRWCSYAVMRFRWYYMCTVTVFNMQYPVTLSTLLSQPINTVAVFGNKVKMECSRNPHVYPVDWEFASSGSNNFSYIYVSERITEKLTSDYKIDTDNNTRYDIVIDSVAFYHAGTYICTPITEGVVNTPSYSAELIILGLDPVCNTNASDFVEDDYIQMWCTVNYSGNWIPVMEWIGNNRQTIYAGVFYSNKTTTTTSSLITQLKANDNGVTFTCKTSFKTTSTKISRTRRPGETLATNVPDYQHLWNYTPTWRSQIPMEQYIIISIIVVGAMCCLVLTLYLCNNRCPYKRRIARPEPDILQAAQINPYDIAESLEDHSTDRPHSVQALHPPGVQGGNLQEQLPLPVYAEVRRKENKSVADPSERQPLQPLIPVYSLVEKETRDDESRSVAKGAVGHLPRHQCLPVYTEVVKNRNEPMYSDGRRQTVETTSNRLPPMTLTGADGTQYMDVTSIRDLNARAPIRHPPMFSQVETYASIDHTVDASPPLPPKRQ